MGNIQSMQVEVWGPTEQKQDVRFQIMMKIEQIIHYTNKWPSANGAENKIMFLGSKDTPRADRISH